MNGERKLFKIIIYRRNGAVDTYDNAIEYIWSDELGCVTVVTLEKRLIYPIGVIEKIELDVPADKWGNQKTAVCTKNNDQAVSPTVNQTTEVENVSCKKDIKEEEPIKDGGSRVRRL